MLLYLQDIKVTDRFFSGRSDPSKSSSQKKFLKSQSLVYIKLYVIFSLTARVIVTSLFPLNNIS